MLKLVGSRHAVVVMLIFRATVYRPNLAFTKCLLAANCSSVGLPIGASVWVHRGKPIIERERQVRKKRVRSLRALALKRGVFKNT